LNGLIEQKVSAVLNQLGERKTMEMKMQEVVDRHNSVLRGFEQRLNQMQKVISDKEAQMIHAQAALNEAKMEIARLKRF
jgi:muramoyltetrapeptide carboxypeptidase LdcA involved in peptidoglycan recycling